ncbi:MAG TPA: hypothetical protein VLJ37_04785 [bacterium]|nr:hypothetical protein [bacterium]
MGKILLGIFLGASLAGCTGFVSPGAAPTAPGLAPAAAQKESGDDTVLTADVPSGGDAPYVPPAGTPPPAGSPPPAGEAVAFGKNPMYAVADSLAQPHPGGVSALPADVEGGGKAKTLFDFVITATAEPLCEVTSGPEENAVKYEVKGTIGAALMDGTKVPVTSGCELLKVRFHRSVSKNTVQCQDLSVAEDCRFSGTITVPDGPRPTAYIIRDMGKSTQDCGDVDGIDARGRWGETVFMPPPAGGLSVCQPQKIYDIFKL